MIEEYYLATKKLGPLEPASFILSDAMTKDAALKEYRKRIVCEGTANLKLLRTVDVILSVHVKEGA